MMEIMTNFVSLMYMNIENSAGYTLCYSRCSLRYRIAQATFLIYDCFFLDVIYVLFG
jgi:hypothetical protein